MRRKSTVNAPENTDISAINQGKISITPLHTILFNRPLLDMDESFCQNLLADLKAPAPAY
ncbi:MAG: hypothetical protein FWH51_05180 [Dehalococcoidia bacterium]|nr:hypothetical protein [Dehalococcoidia bacterium]